MRLPCREEQKRSESQGDEDNITGQMLDVVTDLGAHVARNTSLQHYDFKEGGNVTEEALGRFSSAFYDQDQIAADHLYPNGNWGISNTTNFSSLDEHDCSDQLPPSMSRLHEFQIIKAVVLAAVTVVILISICKMVFQLFVRYTVKHDK
jgi:hypothetical protein